MDSNANVNLMNFPLRCSSLLPPKLPILGNFREEFWFKVPYSWGIWGAARINHRSERFIELMLTQRKFDELLALAADSLTS
ncbi:hypothetical protein [Phormidesmis sp. 146-33]